MCTASVKIAVTVSGALLMVAGGTAAFAQAQPDTTGTQILRQVEPPAIPEQVVKPRQEVQIAEPAPSGGPQISVTGFTFDGNRLFGDRLLANAVQRFIGQKLSLAELNYAADLIGKLYQDRGFFARAVVPVQQVADGIVRIQIVEGRLDRIEVDPSAAGEHDDRLRAYVAAGLQSGDRLDLNRIERGTLLLNQLPGRSFRTVLRAGASEGTSSVVVVSEPGQAKRFSAMVDASGSSRAGRGRMILTASLSPQAAYGDDLGLIVLTSRGVQYGRAAYSLPLGSDGLLASVALSALRYKLLYSPVTLKGNSGAAIVNLRYPLVMQADRAVMVSVEGGYRRFSDRVATVVTSRSLGYGSVSLDISRADQLLGGGDTAIGFSLLAGQTSAQRVHSRMSGYIQRRQKLTNKDTLSLRLTGQIGSPDLDSSQLLMVNGTSGVASFSNDDDVSGRSGVVGRATFEHEFSSALRASVFYDLGKVYGAAASRPTLLQGVGIGANWQVLPGVAIDASVAQPIRAPSAFDNKVKAWISARVTF